MSSVTAPAGGPGELAGRLMARTSWSAEQLARHQRIQLDGLLRHATKVSPFYRRRLGSDPTGAELSELPVLSKEDLTAHHDEIVADRALRHSALVDHLAGPSRGERLAGHLVFSTSGSTGEPAVFVTTPADFAPLVAGLLRSMALLGVRPGMRIAALGSGSGMHISRHMVDGLLAGAPSDAPRTSASMPIEQIVAAFNQYQPEVIPGHPSVLALAAHEQLAGRLRISPRILVYTGEVLTDDMRETILAAWGVEPAALYATTEAGVLASGHPRGAGLHIWEDLTLVEVLDATGLPVAPGVAGRRVLLTNLVNRTQPLIRYEITDLVTLAAGPDPTGTPFRRIAALTGRSDDIVVLPTAAGDTIALDPARLRAPVATVPGIRQYQILAGPRGIRIVVVLTPQAPADTPRRLQAAMCSALVEAGAAPPPITVTTVESIAAEPGHAAKFATVKAQPSI